MFTEKFPAYVSQGSAIHCEVDGFSCTATIYTDDDSSPPWERDCGHGPVSEWTNRKIKAGERILNEDQGRAVRFYDFAEACRIALADGWGMKEGRRHGERAKAYAARCAEHDFQVLKAWCNDEWFYCGVAVTVEFMGISLTGRYDHAIWGTEANYPGAENAYLLELANEILPGALAAAKKRAHELRGQLASLEGLTGG